MKSSWKAVPSVVAVLALSGCLTPSEGRACGRALGGHPRAEPLSTRDAATAQLVGRDFDWRSTTDYGPARLWERDASGNVYFERRSGVTIGQGDDGRWSVLKHSAANAFRPDQAVRLSSGAPEAVEVSLDNYEYGTDRDGQDRLRLLPRRGPDSTSPERPGVDEPPPRAATN